jgi:HlyD family secretion protein
MLKKPSKKQSIVIGTALVVIIVAAGVFVKGSGSAKAETKTVLPSVTQIMNGDIDERVTAEGTVQAADEYSIFIELSQEVKEVYAEVGDVVDEGQLLVTYETEDTKKELENKVKQAEITLENAQITLNELVAPTEETELLDLQNQVLSAEKSLSDTEQSLSDTQEDIADLEKNLPYYKQLLDIGSISQQEYDDYNSEYQTLLLEETQLEKDIESCKLTLEKAQINLSNGQTTLATTSEQNSYQKQLNTVETAKMDLETAQDNLAKLTEATYSPISGTIIESSAVEGQMLTDSTAIMKIADLSNLDVLAYVSEYDIAKVQVGQQVELTTDGIEDEIFHGTVTKIEPVAESQGTISGSETVVPVLVHLDDADDRIKPGFSFDMEIIVTDLSGTDYIPISAVVKDSETDTYYVYVVGDDENKTLEKRQVEIGTVSDMYIQILSGLEKDEQILESPDSTTEEGKSLNDYATEVTINQESQTQSDSSSILDSVTGGGGAPAGGGMPAGGGGMPGGGGGGRPGM